MNPQVIAGCVSEREEDGAVVVTAPGGERHRLHPITAAVFDHADGSRRVDELLAVARAVEPAVTAEWLWSALDALADAGLLTARVAPPGGAVDDSLSGPMTRRTMLRRIGIVGAVSAASFAVALPAAGSGSPDIGGEQQQKRMAAERARFDAALSRSGEEGQKRAAATEANVKRSAEAVRGFEEADKKRYEAMEKSIKRGGRPS